jgi:outer membrane lipoprotein-sorting protein/peroxiredoxin
MAENYKHALSYSDTTALAATSNGIVPASTIANLNFRATISWKRPDKVIAVKTSANGDVARVVSDGKTRWIVTPQQKGIYLKQPSTGNSIFDSLKSINVSTPGLGIILDGQAVDTMLDQGLASLKLGGVSSFENISVQKVIGNIDLPSGGTTTETFLIGTNDGLLRRMTMDYSTSAGHLQIVETHSSINFNPSLSVSVFTFTPAAGAKSADSYNSTNPDKYKPAVSVGHALPNFQSVDLNGKPISLADYKGKVVIIHFFSTWEQSAESVPDVVKLYNKYKSKGLVVIGVSLDGRRDRVAQLVANDSVPYRVVFDGKQWKNAVARQYGIRVLPTTLLVARDGILVAITDNPQDPKLPNAITDALAR